MKILKKKNIGILEVYVIFISCIYVGFIGYKSLLNFLFHTELLRLHYREKILELSRNSSYIFFILQIKEIFIFENVYFFTVFYFFSFIIKKIFNLWMSFLYYQFHYH